MIEQKERISDIYGLISKLDISPQGSFSLGTVVRPYKNNKESSFDLDAICQIEISKDATNPKSIKEMVELAFESDERHKSRLKKYDKCCTIQYADIGEIGFSIDIVPAVDEDLKTKSLLKQKSLESRYIDTAIAITDKKTEEYEWATNNPKGFKEWFQKINKPFLEHNLEQSRLNIFESYKGIFASIKKFHLSWNVRHYKG